MGHWAFTWLFVSSWGRNIIHCVGYLQLQFLYQYVPPYKHTDVLHVYVCVQYNVAYIIYYII